MALVINDRVKETSTTTGTGTFTLAGAVQGFETFSSAIGNTNTTYYAISNQANGEFEVGLGTVGAGTLARTTIISSSNSDSAVNFSAGTKDVFCTLPASKAVILDSSGNIVANNGSNLTNLNADNLASGTLPDARFPATLPATSGANLTALNATQLTSGTVPDAAFPATLPAVSGSNLTNLNASNLASGTLPDARFPATLPAVNGSALTNLDADNLASGTVPDARFPATLPAANGSALTNLDADNLASGTLPDARFPATLPAASGANLTSLNASNLASGTVPIARIDLNLLTTSTADADGDFFAVVDSVGAEKKLTKGNIAISGFNNDSGFIDGSSLNASNLDSGTVPDARFPATLPAASGTNLTSLNASNLSSGTVADARFPATLPAISGANLTNLDASDLASGTVPIARIDLNLLTTSTADGDGDFFVVVDSVGAEKKLTKANINISGFNNNSGFTTNTGTVTSVTGGNGLTGTVTTSGSLAVGAGTGIDVAADAISVDVSDFMTNGSNNRVLTATGADAMNAESDLVYDGSQFGINLSSPTRALDVSSSQIIVAEFSSTNASFARIKVPNGGSDNAYFGSFSSDARINGTSIVFEDGATERMRVTESGGATRVGIATASPGSTLDVNGSLSKSSGSFKIDHPLESKKNTHHLVHSFVEAPQADNIYRGKINLVNGTATVNIDTVAGMSEGTFVLLNREIQCFTSNETGWTAVKGSVSGNILTITAQDNICTDTISWMVIGERHDDHMYDTEWTDENGKVIVEPLK
jgi:surfactin synthase thioesterase subunit